MAGMAKVCVRVETETVFLVKTDILFLMSGHQSQPSRHVLDWLAEWSCLLHHDPLAPPRPEGHRPGRDGGALEDGQHPHTEAEGVVSSQNIL